MTEPTVLPLTAAQQGLLVVHRTVPGMPHLYNVVAELELDPALSPDTVRGCLHAVLGVQPALRLAVRHLPAPHAELPADIPPPPFRVAEPPAGEYAAVRGELLRELGATVLDPESAPLLRTVLVRAADGSRSALLLVVHHLVFDGFSLRLFARDLTAAVRGELDADRLRAAREHAWRTELAAQLGSADSERADGEAAEIADRLRRVPATVLYPRPNRPVRTDFSGERRDIPLSAARSRAVDALCARLGISPFVFFSALYAALLGRHSGNGSVVFGTPVMSRRTVGSYDLCGFFVNTLPVVLDLDPDMPFDTFARQTVGAEAERLRRTAALSFDRIVRHADPDRSTDRNPLFSCMLAMQDTADTGPDQVVRRSREHGNGTAKFDLWLGVTRTPDGWLLELEHDSTLLPPPVTDGIAESLSSAVRAVLADSATVLSGLFEDASLDASRADDGLRCEPPRPDLYRWVCDTIARQPDAVALEEDGRTLTYGGLGARVRAAAAGLARRGVGPGTVVGLTTSALSDTVVAVLATLARRAAFLPLDLGLPGDRLAYMAGKAGCRLVVGEGTVAGAEVVPPTALDTPGDDPGQEEGTGEDGVYIMFTSGSTGRPKGVLMTNGPLVNLTAWQTAALEMSEKTRFLQYAPLGFDVSFQEIVPTLAAGGVLVARGTAARGDLHAVCERAGAERVTHLYLPVAALRPFAQAARRAGNPLAELRHLCVSGEQLTLDEDTRAFLRERPHIGLVNLYGPTETHAVTTHRLTSDPDGAPAHVPIGVPLAGVTAYVRDGSGHLAPCGVPGELYLGGACPADGYVGEPGLSAERFLPDPYGPDRTARMYRTGDWVLRDEHGALLFLGREDDQVKIRGHRVELGEPETAARAHPRVRQAVAAVHGDGADGRLVLFVVPDEDGPAPDPAEVRDRLAAVLPAHMVPFRVLVADAVPTTPNGKTDREALLRGVEPALLSERPAGTGPPAAATDPVQLWLQEFWTGLLGGAEVTVDDSLLSHGVHSLNALTAAGEIENRYGVRIPFRIFFRTPTIRAHAAWINGALGHGEPRAGDARTEGARA